MKLFSRSMAAIAFGFLMFGAVTGAAAAPVVSLPGADKDDPAKVAAAKDFIIAYHPHMDPRIIAKEVEHALPQMFAAAREKDRKLDRKKFEQDTLAHFRESSAGMLELQGHIVSRHFTLQELKDMAAFYSSPLGRKLLAETPKIRQEMTQEKRRQQALEDKKTPPHASKPLIKHK